MKILLVDDSQVERHIIKKYLERRGFTIIEASNGLEALGMNEAARPDLIISDILMPVMDGFNFLKKLRLDKAGRDTAFIFYSAVYEDKKEIALAYALNADDFIVKTKDLDAFFNQLTRTLERIGNKAKHPVRKLYIEEKEFLEKYTSVVANKLEQKVQELYAENISRQKAQREIGFLQSIVKNVSEAVCLIDYDGTIIFWNAASEKMFGYKPEEILQHPYTRLIPQELVEKDFMNFTQTLSEVGLITNYESQRITKKGKTFPVNITAVAARDEDNRIVGYSAITQDMTDYEFAHKNQKLTNNILTVLNSADPFFSSVGRALLMIMDYAEVKAAGIRLKEGDDYPYLATNGFSEPFLQGEQYLGARDEKNRPILDDDGKPRLACLCGNVLLKHTTANDYPFFTPAGSFWTNSLTKWLATPAGHGLHTSTSFRCHTEGYESLALIPLRAGVKTPGLLQLADKRPNRFTTKIIAFLEGIGEIMCVALLRNQTEREIQKLNEELEHKVEERTSTLKQTIIQMEELNRVFVGRELKMVELKARIAELEKRVIRNS